MNENIPEVDIIIPVYNAFEDLALCVRSILKHTDLAYTRLLLIDDKSTDDRVAPYLEELAAQGYPGITVLTNEQNMGFAETVSRGIEQSKRDVVLLNSDTIVTEGWLEGLITAAYRDPSVGTVTPMSNIALHFTVSFDQENIPIDRIGERLRAASLHDYPDIDVSMGSCMYIRRAVWNEVGKLDVETDRMRYGEEVDFCFRCQQLGYRHILCDDVFVYHKGAASFFENNRLQRLKTKDQILYKKYDVQMENTLRLAESSSQGDWAINAELYAEIENGRKNLLYMVHSDFREDAQKNIGGTQFHVKDLTMNLRDTYNVFVAARDGYYLRVTAYIGSKRLSFKYYIGAVPEFPVYHSKNMRELWDDLLSAFEIDLVHIHHTYSLTLDLYDAAKSRGLPLIATLHDFYTVCPSINMLEKGVRLCIGRETPEICKRCLRGYFNVSSTVDLLSKWRKEHLHALMCCDVLILPSENTKKIFESYYPELAGRLTVMAHGCDKPLRMSELYDRFERSNSVRFNIESSQTQIAGGQIAGWCYLEGHESVSSQLYVALSCGETHILVPVTAYDREDIAAIDQRYRRSGFSMMLPVTRLNTGTWTIRMGVQNSGSLVLSDLSVHIESFEQKVKKRLHVAFIGGMNLAKGSQIAYDMIKQGPKNINWFIFGGIGDHVLAQLKQDNLSMTNWYRRENLCDMLDLYQIDLVCIPSICPETFCYTLSEAVLSGRPVLTTDLGAPADRVREMDCGWVVSVEDCARNMLAKVEEICRKPELLEEKSAHVKALHHKTNAEMAAEYDLLYKGFALADNKGRSFNARRIYEGYLLGGKVRGRGQDGKLTGVDMQTRVDELEQELEAIHRSTAYKVAQVMRRLRIPCKRQIKTLMFQVYKLLKR